VVNTTGATNPGSANPFYYAYAEFTVPVAEQAFGGCTGAWDYSSSWVAIDG
jgi:hypothetical protein